MNTAPKLFFAFISLGGTSLAYAALRHANELGLATLQGFLLAALGVFVGLMCLTTAAAVVTMAYVLEGGRITVQVFGSRCLWSKELAGLVSVDRRTYYPGFSGVQFTWAGGDHRDFLSAELERSLWPHAPRDT